MRRWLGPARARPETDVRVAVADGAFRGYVDVEADPNATYWVDLRVHPVRATTT